MSVKKKCVQPSNKKKKKDKSPFVIVPHEYFILRPEHAANGSDLDDVATFSGGGAGERRGSAVGSVFRQSN